MNSRETKPFPPTRLPWEGGVIALFIRGGSPPRILPAADGKIRCFFVASTHSLPQMEKLFDSGKVIQGDVWSLFSVKNLKFFFHF